MSSGKLRRESWGSCVSLEYSPMGESPYHVKHKRDEPRYVMTQFSSHARAQLPTHAGASSALE